MKTYNTILLIAVMIFASLQLANAQITTSEIQVENTQNITSITGTVGIGTSNASVPLEIAPKTDSETLLVGRADGKSSIKASTDGSGHLIMDSRSDQYVSLNHYVSDHVVLAYGGGDVGIGTATPNAPLEIASKTDRETLLVGRADGMASVKASTDGSGHLIMDSRSEQYVSLNHYVSDHVVLAYGGGNVGIGTADPAYKLEVEGTVRATTFSAVTPPWADFVFEEDFRLKPLTEVEKFINKNKHLPDIPSERELQKTGLDLPAMDAKLLQKIEELTLYTIAQQKEIEKLKKENKVLKSLSERLAIIERQLKSKR